MNPALPEPEPALPEFQTPVRALVEFVHRRGDLAGSGLFQSGDRALEGTRGHQRLQQSRGEAYQAEIPIQWRGEREGVCLTLTGRVDGVIEATDAEDVPVVEEIKTVDHRWNGEAHPLHWAQLRIYAAILAAQHGWERVQLRLTYFDYRIDEETPFLELESADSLLAFLEETLSQWARWLAGQAGWLRQRDRSLAHLPFPFSQFRGGQRALARRVYRRVRDGGNAFIEAPTGLGKTLATLYPAVRALPRIGQGQLFFVTAKTPGRRAANEALAHLRASGARLRSITLTAKEKICFGPTTPCDPRSCPYALGYYDRSRAAVAALLAKETIGREAVEAVAREHHVCPFELALDASLWCDVIIGDFNHCFDPHARLQRHFGDGPARHVVLIDEAHNLVDRSREMYSATLREEDLSAGPEAIRTLGSGRVHQALAEARRALSKRIAEVLASEAPLLPTRSYHDGAVAVADPPEALLAILRHTARTFEAFLAEQPPGTPLNGWLEPWYALSSFLRAADYFDTTYRTVAAPGELTLLCLDPSQHLRETLRGLRAAIFFSATLSPGGYFRALLGGAEGDEAFALGSPFQPEQMPLAILPFNVTFQNRPASLGAVAEAIAAHLQTHPGNHLIFCPSMEYLGQLSAELEAWLPGHPLWCQSPAMNEAEREAFLARFSEDGPMGTGLAVIGGIFSEGIDLPGRRLVGVIIIGTGIPRLSLERDLLRAYFDTAERDGFDFAYRFPGMQRVLQAVGRLIRSEADHGHAILIDRRYLETRYRVLFPAWWPQAENPAG